MSRLAIVAVLAAFLVPAAGGAVAPAPQTKNPVWSPDGTLLAYIRALGSGSIGRVFVVGADGSRNRALTPLHVAPYGLSWSPDGGALSYSSEGDIWRVDLSGRVTRLTDDPRLDAFQTAWSPDGATIAFATGGGSCIRCTSIYAIDSDGSDLRRLRLDARLPAWSPDGALLLTSLPVVLIDVATGEERHVAHGWSAAWSHDGGEFTYADTDGLFVATPGGAAKLVRPGGVGFSALSPRGDRIAFLRGRRVRILHRGTQSEILLGRSDSGHDAPTWSIRGRLAFVSAGPCGRRSQIDVVRADGSQRRTLVRACGDARR